MLSDERIEVEHERELAEQQDSLTVGMQPMTEENMAEGGWVRGPLDADGKMWRSGDMSDSNWGMIEGIAYEDGRWLVSGHDTSAPWIPADSIRHYHEPTVEDVLGRGTCRMCKRKGYDREYLHHYECSECGEEVLRSSVMGESEPPRFCPNCGRKVVTNG